MKRLLFIAAMLLMVGGASAQKKEAQTVYIVDGKVITEQEFKAIPSGVIKNMNVMKGTESVVIASTASGDFAREASTLAEKDKDLKILHKNEGAGASMVIVSPKLRSEEDLKKMTGTIMQTHTTVSNGDVSTVNIISNKDGIKFTLNDKSPVFLVVDSSGNTTRINDLSEIDASKIESMLVCKKEDEAAKKYGDKYGDLKEGVIVITLRKENTENGSSSNSNAQHTGQKIITVRGDNQVGESLAQNLRIDKALYLGDKKPIFVVTDADGKTNIVESVNNIKIDDIESFEVIKDEKKKAEYEKKYGPSKDGYIHIVLKKSK